MTFADDARLAVLDGVHQCYKKLCFQLLPERRKLYEWMYETVCISADK